MNFFFIVVSIITVVYGYIGWRLIVPSGVGFPVNVLLWALMLVFLALPFIATFLRFSGSDGFWTYVFTWVAYLSLGFFSLVFVFLVIRDLALLITAGAAKAATFIRTILGEGAASHDPSNPDRHRFLVHSMNMGILGITGILSGYGIYEARRNPRIVTVTIPLHHLPGDLDGFRIVQITDIHAGTTIKRGFVQSIVNTARSISCDVIVFTGDCADGSADSIRDDVAPLAELSAPCGTYFVTGNHEYYSGVESWIEEMERLGYRVLLNEHSIIQRGTSSILLAGVTDYNGGQFLASHASSPETARDGAPSCDVSILLAHQPRSIFKASHAGYDLQISGHTHGGQYVPWNFLVSLQQPYISGLHLHESTWIYVSRGTGYWGPPLRGGVPSEITVITLARAQEV